MTRTGYEILGFAVWKGAKWYVRRKLGLGRGKRRVVLLGLAGAAVAAVVAVEAGKRR